MRLEQILLLLAGLVLVACFFLTFLNWEPKLMGMKVGETQYSGYAMTRTLLDEAEILEYEDTKLTSNMITELVEEANTWQDYSAIAGIVFVLLGPLFYLLLGLGYIVRAFRGKSYKRGIWFNLIFLGAGWGAFWWASKVVTDKAAFVKNALNTSIDVSFFEVASIGFWLAFAAVFVAGFSLIFEKQG
ncbi:MAG: hypothetical protein AAFY71_11775 [Bacteroidota bacterium]